MGRTAQPLGQLLEERGNAGELELFMSSMHEKVHLTATSRKFWEDYKKK